MEKSIESKMTRLGIRKTERQPSDVWRVCVLEFVLERGCFHSTFANFDTIAKDAVFLSRNAFDLKWRAMF